MSNAKKTSSKKAPKAKAPVSKRPLILGKYSPVAVIGFYGQRKGATLDQIVGALDAIAKEMGLKKLASPATIQRKRFSEGTARSQRRWSRLLGSRASDRSHPLLSKAL